MSNLRTPGKVVMLVVNDGNDVRALKEAHSLASHGYDVTVIGRKAGLHEVEERMQGNVSIKVVPQIVDPADLIRHANASSELSLQG